MAPLNMLAANPVLEPKSPAGDQAALNLTNVVKTFDSDVEMPWSRLWRRLQPTAGMTAVDHVDLEVPPGEVFGVLGANGSGKSTLIRLISTLLIPDAGQVLVFGHDAVTEEMTVKRMLNRVSMEASFFKKLSAMENLMYAARLYS